VLISGAVTGGRCLVTILTDGQGKNGSTVAVSVVMVTETLHGVARIPVYCHHCYLWLQHYLA